MKHARMMQLIILSTLLLGISIQTETKPSENSSRNASQEAQMAELMEFAADAVAQAFSSLQKIENKMTEIALLVKKGLSRDIARNSNAIMKVLTENKMTLNAVLQNQAAIAALKDPFQQLEVAVVITELCNAFIPYLVQQINSNFKKAKPFNVGNFFKNLEKKQTRSKLNHLEPAALIKRLNAAQTKLESLDTTVQSMGLTWYNKAARALDHYVVTPANNYHVPTIAAYTAGIGLLSAYTLWSYGYLIKDAKTTPAWLKDSVKYLYDKFGGPVVRNRAGNPKLIKSDTVIDDSYNVWGTGSYNPSEEEKIPTDATLFAATDFTVKDFMLQNQPLGALGAGFIITSLVKTWPTIKEKLEKRRDAIWNFLRGGEYLNTFKPGLTQMKPTVSFKDMVGLDEVKEAFYSIIQYIDNPEQLMRIEATPEKGWLLTGPPRTGKTFSVECLCGEIEIMMAKRGMANKMKFFNINASLINEYGIKAILDEVYENAPAVIFIDEIDLLGLQRVGNNKLLSDFLTAMQSSMNADPAKIVIVIAATNKPENIDSALRQNGRFGKEIRFDYPSRKYRVQFLMRELTNMALNIREFDIETLANKTNDKSFEDLKRVIRNAMTRSWMHGTSLTQALLEESIDTEIHNLIIFNRKALPENETRIVATHFAGQALASLFLETHEQLDKITTHAYMANLKDEAIWENYSKKDANDEQKKIEYGKFITKQSHDTINVKNQTLIVNEAILLLAGFAAEELLLGPCGFTCHKGDQNKAYKLIQELIFGGLLQETLPKAVNEELKLKAYTLLQECHKKAMALLIEHKDALLVVIDELMKKQILNSKEIQAIINRVENKTSDVIAQESDTTEDEDSSLDDIFEDTQEESITEENEEVEDITEPIIEPVQDETPVIEETIEPMTEETALEIEPEETAQPVEPFLTQESKPVNPTIKEKLVTLLVNVQNNTMNFLKDSYVKVASYIAAAPTQTDAVEQADIVEQEEDTTEATIETEPTLPESMIIEPVMTPVITNEPTIEESTIAITAEETAQDLADEATEEEESETFLLVEEDKPVNPTIKEKLVTLLVNVHNNTMNFLKDSYAKVTAYIATVKPQAAAAEQVDIVEQEVDTTEATIETEPALTEETAQDLTDDATEEESETFLLVEEDKPVNPTIKEKLVTLLVNVQNNTMNFLKDSYAKVTAYIATVKPQADATEQIEVAPSTDNDYEDVSLSDESLNTSEI